MSGVPIATAVHLHLTQSIGPSTPPHPRPLSQSPNESIPPTHTLPPPQENIRDAYRRLDSGDDHLCERTSTEWLRRQDCHHPGGGRIPTDGWQSHPSLDRVFVIGRSLGRTVQGEVSHWQGIPGDWSFMHSFFFFLFHRKNKRQRRNFSSTLLWVYVMVGSRGAFWVFGVSVY